MTANQYLSESYSGPDNNRPRLTCKDGFEMSVQASRFHYCSPRVTLGREGQYDAVEIGYPSHVEELLMPFAEDAKKPLETVYAYVPVGIVDVVIEKHGGAR